MRESTLKIGNAQSFWGDSPKAPFRLVSQAPDLDILTLDYLSEVSLSIMAIQRSKNPLKGYAEDFVEVVASLIPFWKAGRPLKVVANAGGLNPKACAEACQAILKKAGVDLKIGIVFGDDVLDHLKAHPEEALTAHLETGASLKTVLSQVNTANAYLGGQGIAEALLQGAQIIITGRIADPSLVVGPCVAHFKWDWEDYQKLACATVAGHLIECGTQVTGGISCQWLDLPKTDQIGHPIIEMHADGTFVVTKPVGTGGIVNEWTVKEQLLYEIGDPHNYLSPDVTVSFLSLELTPVGENRIQVRGAQGRKPTDSYKVSATFQDGYKAEAFLTLFGDDLKEKVKRSAEAIYAHVEQDGYRLEKFYVECLGALDVIPGIFARQEPLECVLRIAAADSRKEALEYFSKEIAPLVCCGPPGITGYASGRPKIRPVYGYWPCLIAKKDCVYQVEMLT